MKRLGILTTARPENGGSYQYSLAMIEALSLLDGWQKTLYAPREMLWLSNFIPSLNELDVSVPQSIQLVALDAVGVHVRDPFAGEDVVIAPLYSPHLLHTKTPFCYTLHDLQDRHLPQYFSVAQRLWRRHVHGRLTRRAARLLCESDFVRRDIAQFFEVPEAKIAVIPSMPLWENMPAIDAGDLAMVRAKFALPVSFLFYPAQFWAHKNHVRLLAAFSSIAPRFPDVQLILTGHRRFEFEKVMREVAKLGLTGRVRHLGYVESADLPRIYKLATALIMPSLFESISIPVYEAFRADTPVCASGILGLVDQIGDAGITFDPLSEDSISQAMTRILSDSVLRETLVERGRQRLSTMTLQRYACQLEALVRDILQA